MLRQPHGQLRFEGQLVTFADGTQAEVDDVIYATGYETTFPFLDESVLCARDNRVRLYMRTFVPERKSAGPHEAAQ